MSDYDVLDYIPVIGDIYRYGKLGYNIGSFLVGDDSVDDLLNQMIDKINRAVSADSIEDVTTEMAEFSDLVDRYNGGKKYQNAIFGYLLARGIHIIALCKWASNPYSIKEQPEIDDCFRKAEDACSLVMQIEKTLFTSNRSTIDQVRTLISDEKKAIKQSRNEWKRHCYKLDKALHPWKYRLMWIIPLVILVLIAIIAIIAFFLNKYS